MGCVGLVTISIHLYRMLNIYLSTYPRITISFTILTVSQCFILQWSSKFTRHFPKAPFHESYPALIVDVLVRKLHFIFVSTCLIGCNMQPRTQLEAVTQAAAHRCIFTQNRLPNCPLQLCAARGASSPSPAATLVRPPHPRPRTTPSSPAPSKS
jgi:hypothetical protein